jgi:membrane protein implicated in regulation of membrane protease activity
MEGNAALAWWIAAAVLVAGELASGTFYVLMIAVGFVAGAVAAHAGAGPALQMAVAAIVGGGAVAAWNVRRRRGATRLAPARNPDINLDVGERVHVDAWHPDGTARIRYRGAEWNVRFIGTGIPAPGAHVIAEMRHNELALRRAD